MKITLLSIAILMLFILQSKAQSNFSIRGKVVESALRINLEDATVMALNAKDSVLQKFTRVLRDGSFVIDKLPAGKFIISIFYKGYAEYTETFTLNNTVADYNAGTINMILKSKLLQNVIIKGQPIAVRIKGDTTEFNAKAYVVQPNDRVEDLIRQFPGIQVSRNGRITVQGQEVKKVLVDGEEFFGDDPTLVTRNIRADMVEKAQLYDKKSDQATFTGIDDGVKTKTLNIVLKQDKKSGYFGKLSAGAGTDKYDQLQGMYNKFTDKYKFAAYTTDGNTGSTGLNWQDSQKYGASSQIDDNGGIITSFYAGDDLDSYDGRYSNQGIPDAKTGGLHYDAKWGNQAVNANYKIGSLEVAGTKNSMVQNNLPLATQLSNTDQTFDNYIFRQKLDLTYLIKIDTSANIKISVDGTKKHSTSDNTFATSSYQSGKLVNNNTRSLNNKVDEDIFNASVFYTKKFKKNFRTLSVLVNESNNKNDGTGYLKSNINFFKTGTTPDSSSNIDQFKINTGKDVIFNSNITYTEPVLKNLNVSLNYDINFNNGTLNKRSYNSTGPNVYNALDTSVSNSYKLNQFSNQLGAIFNYKKEKSIINFGTKASNVSFKQTNEYTNEVLKRHFINWSPMANLRYSISSVKSFTVNYNGNTIQPGISQIQPVKINTNPTFVYVGNPNLTPAFSNNISFSYSTYQILAKQYFKFGGGYSTTSNPIVDNISTNADAISTVQYVNLSGKASSNTNFNVSFGKNIKAVDVGIALELTTNFYKDYNYANGVLAASSSGYYSAALTLGKFVAKKYAIYLNAGPSVRISKSALQAFNNNSTDFGGSARYDVYLPANIIFSTDVNYSYQGKTQIFDNDRSKTILNSSIGRSFFKENALKILLAGNDLLNQNIGLGRSTNGNTIAQTSYTTIKRYFMLSITWEFNKMGNVKTSTK